MKVELKGTNLIITLPVELKNPPRSGKNGDGKTMMLGCSRGPKEQDIAVLGQNIHVNAMAYIYPPRN